MSQQPRAGPVRLDKASAIPLYVQVKEWLLQRILSGHYQDQVDSENVLAAEWKVSRRTIQQAMDMLVDMGVLERRRGSGTYVNPRRRKHLYLVIPSYTQDLAELGAEPVTRLLSVNEEQADDRTGGLLNLAPGERVTTIHRLIETKARPFSIVTTRVPQARFPGAEFDGFTGSFYRFLRERHHCIPCRVADSIEAAALDRKEAELLRLPVSTPVLRMHRVGWDQSNVPFEHTESLVQTADAPLRIDIEHRLGSSGKPLHDQDWHYRVGFGGFLG